MGGIWIVVGASLLGLVSILLIAGSLWASSSGRKRPRASSVVSGSYPPRPIVNQQVPIGHGYVAPPSAERTMITAPPSAGETVMMPPPGPYAMPMEEPRVDQATQFLTVDDIFALADDRVEPTRILDPDELLVHEPVPASPSPRPVVAASPIARSPIPAPSMASIPAASIPAASIPRQPSQPAPSKPAAAPPSKFAPPDPSAFVKPAVEAQPTPYVGFVAPRSPGLEDDDDIDDDDDDPETELVHQAELMRLMMKSKPPG